MNDGPAQRHTIKRQVLEVRGCAVEDRERAQSAIRAAFNALIPSIERTCSGLSRPDRLQRIDRLEIELGEVSIDALESAVAEEFNRVFAARLAAALESARSTPIDVDLELFSYFIRTGTVPWWADRSDRHLLETRLDAAIASDPGGVRQAIASTPDRHAVWRRIALACSDRLLDNVLGAVAPRFAQAHPGIATQWRFLIEVVAARHGRSRPVARALWWEEFLRAADAAEVPESDTPGLFRDALFNVARRLGLEYGALISALHHVLEQERPEISLHGSVREVLERLHRDVLTARAGPVMVRPRVEPAGIDGAAPDSTSSDRPSHATEAEIEGLLARLENSSDPLDADARSRLQLLVGMLPSHRRANVVARRRRTAAEDVPPADRSDTTDVRASVDLTFSDIDEIYVENGGLVILWPFLHSFFTHLGLIEEKRFRDIAARQRAVGLLQYVAAADAQPREFVLPLNKVLCGMPVDEVFDFGPEITDVEMDACTDLIAAAIHHAPILRDMSVDGFRGSFLLRQAQLSVRDGHWLLRVQRETHDIVLDRFSWSVAIVKLPWMPALLPVEW